MPVLTIKNVIGELGWMAPELLDDPEFMEEWSQSKFGVGYEENLTDLLNHYRDIKDICHEDSLARDGMEMIEAAMRRNDDGDG